MNQHGFVNSYDEHKVCVHVLCSSWREFVMDFEDDVKSCFSFFTTAAEKKA
jgi:hypothetical protein